MCVDVDRFLNGTRDAQSECAKNVIPSNGALIHAFAVMLTFLRAIGIPIKITFFNRKCTLKASGIDVQVYILVS